MEGRNGRWSRWLAAVSLAGLLGALLAAGGCGEGVDGPAMKADGEGSPGPTPAPAAVLPLGGGTALPVDLPQAPREVVRWEADGTMTGTWQGTWNFHGRAVEGAARITLRHYDESFNGYVEMTPDVGAVCGKTSGTIVWGLQFDDYVTFGFYDLFAYGFTFHGTLRDEVLAGDFLAITQCGAESGTFRVSL